MNRTTCKTLKQLEKTIRELTAYDRPVCYKLSELLILPYRSGWIVFYQQDAR